MLIKPEAWSILQHAALSRRCLIQGNCRRDKVGDITHRIDGGTGEHIVIVCGFRNDSARKVIRSHLRANHSWVRFTTHWRWDHHARFVVRRIPATGRTWVHLRPSRQDERDWETQTNFGKYRYP